MQALSPDLILFAAAVAVLAGLIKGMVGFALPMVMISGLGSVMAPDTALAFLILPTLATNLWQALRQGVSAALGSVRRFRWFLISCFALMIAAAQLVQWMSPALMLLVIGVPMTVYAAAMLSGRPPRLPGPPGRGVEIVLGAVAGVFGGLSGVWGPPTVALLSALDTEKTDQMRVQGVIYGAGAVVLVGAHLASGVLNAATLPASGALVLPAALGLWAGFRIQDRIDQSTFRRLTLLVLLIAGLNLVRRGLIGL